MNSVVHVDFIDIVRPGSKHTGSIKTIIYYGGDLNMIKAAASLIGLNATDFIRTCTVQAARKIMQNAKADGSSI